ELILSRELSDKRIFPAINLKLSGTRKEELLLSEKNMKNMFILRQFINDVNVEEALTFFMNLMKKYTENQDLYEAVEKQKI
ncbi:MAG TPA: transcription termination factor Rho, partial [Petrotogaceae bacterium]|nr:transcription termination factor Rho [Petrotogaceae bacterium]